MIDSIGKMIMAGGQGGWIVPLIVFLFYAFINISKAIAERKNQQKLDEQPTDMQKPRHKPIDGPDYTTTRRARNLPYAPKNDRPAPQKIMPRIQSRPAAVQSKPVALPAHAQRPESVQAPVPVPVRRQTDAQKIRRPRPVQQAAAQPAKRLRRKLPRAVQKKQVPQKAVIQKPVQQKTQTGEAARTPPAATRIIHLLHNSNELKKGIIYAEILGKPIALKDDHNVGLL